MISIKTLEALSNSDYSSLDLLLEKKDELTKTTQWILNNPDFLSTHKEVSEYVFSCLSGNQQIPQETIELLESKISEIAKQTIHKYPKKLTPELIISDEPLENLKNSLSPRDYRLLTEIKKELNLLKDVIIKNGLPFHEGQMFFRLLSFNGQPISEKDLLKIKAETGKVLNKFSNNQLISEKQETYEKECNKLTEKAKELIKDGNTSFSELLSYLADGRQLIANELRHSPIQDFGYLRDDPNRLEITYLNSKQLNSYQERIANLIPPDSKELPPIFKSVYNLSEHSVYGKFATGTINGQKINLTCYASRHEFDIMNMAFWGNVPKDYPKVLLMHTDPSNIPTILEHVDKLVKEFKSLNDKDSLIKKAGEIEWWMAHAMPWRRGSASIAEMLIKSLLSSKGIEISWSSLKSENYQIDMEALSTPNLNDFIPKFYEHISPHIS